MPKYRVWFTAIASASVEVEASDEAEARDVADEEFAYPSICAHCSGWGKDYSLDLGEWQQDDDADGVSEA